MVRTRRRRSTRRRKTRGAGKVDEERKKYGSEKENVNASSRERDAVVDEKAVYELVNSVFPTLGKPTMTDFLERVRKKMLRRGQRLSNEQARTVKLAVYKYMDKNIKEDREGSKTSLIVSSLLNADANENQQTSSGKLAERVRLAAMATKEQDILHEQNAKQKYCESCGKRRVATPTVANLQRIIWRCPNACGTVKRKEEMSVRYCARSGRERAIRGRCMCDECCQARRYPPNTVTRIAHSDPDYEPVIRGKYRKRKTRGFLPEGWTAEIRERGARGGVSAGKYFIYVAPDGTKHRSRVAMARYAQQLSKSNQKRRKSSAVKKVQRAKNKTTDDSTRTETTTMSMDPRSASRRASPSKWFRVKIPTQVKGPGRKFRLRLPNSDRIYTTVVPDGRGPGDIVYLNTRTAVCKEKKWRISAALSLPMKA